MKSKSVVFKYVINGLLIGFIFPVLAVLICVFYLIEDNFIITFYNLHKEFPLLIIIDSAPLVLASVAYVVGTKVNHASRLFVLELNELNEKLTSKNVEKTILLKEVHHRVKNNLQVITSLLSLQSSFIVDEKMKDLFQFSQYRINSMAVIHEMLYQSNDISKLNAKDYINSLVNGLLISMKDSDSNVKLNIEVPEIYFNIDTAIPLGLIINEIITNSLKYGIPGNNSGTIYVRLTKNSDSNFTMYIGDSGIGISNEIDYRTSNSLGLMLIHKLSHQLKGNLELDKLKTGTNYIINFQEVEQVLKK